MTQTAHSAYRQSNHTALTRIDLLVQLYDKTLRTFRDGLTALLDGDDERFQSERFTAYRCLLAILDGIDPSQGEVAQNTQRLCLFVTRLVWQATPESWERAAALLQPMHDSFLAIREEATALELSGQIPALDFRTVYDHSTV